MTHYGDILTNNTRVSVCIPTYNRASLLERAVRSAMAQTYENIEILILDNASPDNTSEILAKLASEDNRIQFEINESNIGAANNFNKVMRSSTSDYCMWLADDDWIDVNYIQECMNQFLNDDSYCLVSGSSELLFDEVRLLKGQQVDIRFDSPVVRMLMYYAWVGDNGIFYGVYKREAALSMLVENILGGDWFFIAGIAYLGKIRTIDKAIVHRSGDGASADLQHLAKVLGHNRLVQKEPYLGVAYGAYKDVMSKDHIYGELNPTIRFCVASLLMISIFFKKVVLQKIFRFFRSIFRYLRSA